MDTCFEVHYLRVNNINVEMKVFWSARSPITPDAVAQRCQTAHWCADGLYCSPALHTQDACGENNLQ